MRSKVVSRFRCLEPSSMMKMFKEASKRSGLINLSLGEPDVLTDPGIVEALRQAGLEGHTHYAPSSGIPELREAIREFWSGTYGLEVPQEQVLVTNGGSQACHLAFQVLLEPGDEVVLLEPYFTFYGQQVCYHGGVAVPVVCREENGFVPRVEDIEGVLTPRTKMLVLNSPCNPSGAVFDRRTLEGIADLAERHDLIVLSDELYEAFVYEGEHVPFATLPGMGRRTLTVGGFSKSFAMCGWRIGYVLGPEEILRPMDLLAVVQTLCVNSLVQRAALHALRHGAPFTRRLHDLFRDRVRCAAEGLNGLPGLSCGVPKGSFYVFFDVSRTGLDGEAFAWRMLEDAGVVMVPGGAFGGSFPNHVRLAATVPEERLREAFGRMRPVLEGLVRV